jgi:hypothetical protein
LAEPKSRTQRVTHRGRDGKQGKVTRAANKSGCEQPSTTASRSVGSWPEGEVLTCVSNVCSRGNCRRDVLALGLTGLTPSGSHYRSPNERVTHSPLMFADLMMGPATRPAPSGTWWCDRNAVALIARVAREHKLSVVEAARRSHLPIAGHHTRRRSPGTRGKRSHW